MSAALEHDPAAELAKARRHIAELEVDLEAAQEDFREAKRYAERTHQRRMEQLDGGALATIRQRAEMATLGDRYRADFDTHAHEDMQALLEMLDLVVGDPW